ncbi:glycosyltransferase [Salinimicrobium catena]|uniref:glycosyltransferase n=1 Tax=Salinimicrobium catena TaxID=390640 RepID=UPI002FE48F92
MNKRKVFIVGPIAFAGGRFLEVNQIANSLKKICSVQIISTESFIYPSTAEKNNFNNQIKILDQLVYQSYRELKFSSLLAYFKNRKAREPYSFVNNYWSKKILNYEKKRLNVLLKALKSADAVILTMQLTSGFLKEIINFCNQHKIACIVRPTGTIKPNDFSPVLKKASQFIFHSKENAYHLINSTKVPYKFIDQSVETEKNLLGIPIEITHPLRFGYLGRLSSEKGITELCEFFSLTKLPFIIGGDGPLKKSVLDTIQNHDNCRYLGGRVPDDKKAEFFEKIDVLLIASHEETGPFTGLEAMAAGKLIISTKVGAMQERLEGTQNQFWFDVKHMYSLDRVISIVLKKKSECLREIALEVRERYIKEYSCVHIQKKYQNAVREILSHNTIL